MSDLLLLRHHWGPRVATHTDIKRGSGSYQSERTCAHCGLVRVTVHPPQGYPWREWRPKDGPQMQFSSTPPCLAQNSALQAENDSAVSSAPVEMRVNPRDTRNPQGPR